LPLSEINRGQISTRFELQAVTQGITVKIIFINNNEVIVKKLSLLIAIITLSSACTWVKVSEDGSKVAVTNMANVSNCEKLRNVTTKVKASVGPIDRNDQKVGTELATMARNEAVNFGGDTVVPTSGINNGSQSFAIYKCK
jgi:uncharacterized membrane protein